MKPLNAPDIATAYFRFLGHFLLLMLSILLVIYAFLKTFTEQMHQLRANRDQYANVLFAQRQMEQKVDSMYSDLRDLNKGLVGSERLVEQRILHKKQELSGLLQQKYLNAQPHEAYRRVTDCVDRMLVLKDSINNEQKRIREVRRDLHDCGNSEKRKK